MATILKLAIIIRVKPSEQLALEAIRNRLPWENAIDIAKRIGLSPSTVRNAAYAGRVSLKRVPPDKDTIQLFVTVTESGCWEWNFGRNDGGYGMFRLGNRTLYVHRYIWALFNDASLLPRRFVCHKCDNPPCCNPAHLFLGTGRDNIMDAKDKGRHNKQGYSLKLTADQVSQIRLLYETAAYSQRSLGRQFNTCHQNVSQIVRGRTWKQ